MSSSKVLTSEQAQKAVARYFEATRAMSAEQWASTFADNGVLEDPVGTPPMTTKEAILEHGKKFVNAHAQVGLHEEFVHVNGNEAMVYWVGRGETKDGQRVQFDGIDHFIFDGDGKIVELRGLWDPTNIRPE